MVEIAHVRTRNIAFSRPPDTLRHNLVSSVSALERTRASSDSWFGPAVCTLVEVTCRDGTTGVGTAGAFHGAAKVVIDAYLSKLLVGLDATNHELLWQTMYRALARFGRSGVAVSAISGLDIACWDLHGKAWGRSVVELLGGKVQERVPAYASRLYALEDLDELADEARLHVKQGFTRMKQRFGFGPSDGQDGMRRNVALVRTVREAVGDEIELAADAYMGWDVGYSVEMARRLSEFGLSWIEEPLMAHDFDGYAELSRRCGQQRWSCGEHLYTKWDFARLLRSRAVGIIQPDVNRVGGLTETRKIFALAEEAGVPVIPHSNEAHNLHAVFSQLSAVAPMVEYFPELDPDTGNELFWKLFDGNSRAVDGWVELDDSVPGLGITLNEDVADRLTLEGTFP